MRLRALARFGAAAVLPSMLRSTAIAQAGDASRSLQLTLDNDLIALRGAGGPPDYDYTHGTRFTAAWAGSPGWVRRLARVRLHCTTATARRQGCVASTAEIGQEIYTPRRDAPLPLPGERPYAGWLYTSAAAHRISTAGVRSIRLGVGLTGRFSFAEHVQRGIHRILGNAPQLGWAHQLGPRAGLVLAYDDARSVQRPLGDGRIGVVLVQWGGAMGNLRTALHAGASASVGLGPRLPWSPAEVHVESPPRVYGLAGYRQELVLHDFFIEGKPSGTDAGANLRPLVGQYELGIGYRWRTVSAEYRYVSRGREYRAQPQAHAYGSLTVTLKGS
jgi:lipid A 3-O-deacylase